MTFQFKDGVDYLILRYTSTKVYYEGLYRCLVYCDSLDLLECSGDATQSPGCSQEHPDMKKKKKKIIYNNLNFIYLFTLKKNQEQPQALSGTPSKNFLPNKF